MFSSIHGLFYLSWYLWACSLTCRGVQASFPSTVEFDLVFPRNETYAPAPLFPFVFAVQNPQLAAALNPGYSFRTFKLDDYDGTIESYGHDLSRANFSESSTYFFYESTKDFRNVEGTWAISWSVFGGNCSYGSGVDGAVGFDGSRPGRITIFTIKKGGQQPDIFSTMTDGACSSQQNSSSRTFNLTGVIDLKNVSTLSPSGTFFKGRDSCAILSPSSPHPPPNPCAVKFDSAIASSISAKLTASACNGDPHPVVSCPPFENLASKLTKPTCGAVSGLLWLAGTLMLLGYIAM